MASSKVNHPDAVTVWVVLLATVKSYVTGTAFASALIRSTKKQIRTLICDGLLYPLRNISIADI